MPFASELIWATILILLLAEMVSLPSSCNCRLTRQSCTISRIKIIHAASWSKLEVAAVNKTISYKGLYYISRDIAIQNSSRHWLAVGLYLGVSSLYHCEMGSCVEVNWSTFSVLTQWHRWTGKVLCHSEIIETSWSISTGLTLDSVSGINIQ